MYVDGFRSMRLGRTLWALLVLKLAAFAVIGHRYFPDVLHAQFDSDEARAEHVLKRLSTPQETP